MLMRLLVRSIWLVGEVVRAMLDYFFRVAFKSASTKRTARALWLQRASRRHLRVFNYTACYTGKVPTHGLMVSNHLGYLDVLVIASITPAVFVSKAEVRNWPVFGLLAALAGTVFVNRERRSQVSKTNEEIEEALRDNCMVVLFPEGTSTNGKGLLPFKTSLLEPVARDNHSLTTCWLHYELTDGDASNEVCYWGDHVFFSHLINLTKKRSIHAEIRFGEFTKETTDRKELARQLHDAVAELQNGLAVSQ
jgi:1-acyl-sn-glycerol-3-phosphate acyltransferase